MSSDYGVDWGSLRTSHGVGVDPGLIRALLYAPDAGSGGRASDQLEGLAFYSRYLEEAALPVTRVLVDAVCNGECTYWGTVYATDALVEITCSHTSAGRTDLPDRCRAVVRAHLPCLYRMADDETTDDTVLSSLIIIMHNTEDDAPTRRVFLERLSHRDLDVLSADEVNRQLAKEHQRQEKEEKEGQA